MFSWKNTKPEHQMITGCILFLLVIFTMTLLIGCDSGWAVCGWEVK